ncbi:MAG TPA: protein kinase [Candidatus Eremiobacteraceae bacterium]|nr:protein kinase [Candidatus Eremiobacteraceae bacterium]
MALQPGEKIGPYEVVAPLGAGGMGEVYRAKDTRLGRDVAIKVLPGSFVADASARQRFEREAKTISGLNHPNICVLYDVGQQNGLEYLVMECVEGETLAKRLERGPLPLEQVLKYGAQIAEALDKAHRSGIVHRDLKPSNVMLTASGAKLLDFGLAKETTPLGTLATITASSPVSPVTQQGTIVGTFQYMSPEQIEGKEVDGRSDIFSLGAVLYEMLTGRRAFEGKTQLSVASAILEKEPESIRATKPITPPALEHAIERCLAKDREDRWQAARDLAMELKWVSASGSQASAPAIAAAKEPSWKKYGVRGGLLLCGALAMILLYGVLGWRSSKAPEQTMTFLAPLPFAVRDMAMAPNGHTVAVASHQEGAKKGALWLYEIGSDEARSLPGTEGGNFPFWSPDGKALGFFADGKLKRVELPSGPVQVLADAPAGRGGTWSKDGVILFTPSGRLRSVILRVPASGGTPTLQVGHEPGLGGGSQRWPLFLPDGKHFLFLSATIANRGPNDGVYAGSLDSKEFHLVAKADSNVVYAEPGYLLCLRDRAILAHKFDPKTMQVSGEPVAVATGPEVLSRIMRATFSASNPEVLLVQKGGNVSLSRLIWFDRAGKQLGTVGNEQVFANPQLTANGKSLAVDQTDEASQNTDLWVYDLQTGTPKRLTFNPALDANPVWSPDGSRVVFTSSRGKNAFDLYVKEASGSEEEKAIVESDEDKYPDSWSPDGKYILYQEGPDLKYLELPEKKTGLFLKAVGTLKNGQFSPDGKWVAYASNESGRWEVYVTSFPEAKGKWQVSVGGGEHPRWRADGKEMFYLSPDAKIMALPVKTAGGFDPGAPVALFQTSPKETLAMSDQFIFDVTPDGQKILVDTQEKSVWQPMTVVLHWGERR